MLERIRRHVYKRALNSTSRRQPTKKSAFSFLRTLGIPVETVIDVGVLTSTQALIQGYPEAHHILCEPICDFADQIYNNYKNQVKSYELIQAAISDKIGHTYMQTSSTQGETITHAKIIIDSDKDIPNLRRVPVMTLDKVVAAGSYMKPFLLKIDIDGHDLAVVNGAHETLKDCNIVCIEASVKNIHQRLPALLNHGFSLFDIVDICYYDNRLIQVDLIFVKTALIKSMGLDFNSDTFNIQKWKDYM